MEEAAAAAVGNIFEGDAGQVAIIDSVVVFRQVEHELFARILIENLSSTCPLLYRLKSNALNKFRVRSPMGIIDPGTEGSIHLDVHWDVNPRTLRYDSFHVLVAKIPGNFPLLNPPHIKLKPSAAYNNMLKRFWKELRDNGVVPETHILVCSIGNKVIRAAAAGTSNARLQEEGPDLDAYLEPQNRAAAAYADLHFSTEDGDEVKRLERTVSAWVACTNSLHEKVHSMERTVWIALGVVCFLLATFAVTLQRYKSERIPVNIRIQLNESVSDPEFLAMIQKMAEPQLQAAGKPTSLLEFLGDVWKSIVDFFTIN